MPERSEAVREKCSKNRDKCLLAPECLQKEEITLESLDDIQKIVQVISSADGSGVRKGVMILSAVSDDALDTK